MPSIKIHCWGGIGSQLFTLAVALDLNKRYPKRPIKLIFHTGGVTRRGVEIDFLPEKFRYEVKDDFIEIKVVKSSNKFHIRKKLMGLLKIVALKSNFISSANNNAEFNKIKFWVFSIRGHYSLREISKGTADTILNLYRDNRNLSTKKITTKSEIALHYRLGDLYYSNIKDYIDVNLISNLIIQLCEKYKVTSIDIYSDSVTKAIDLLKEFAISCKVNSVQSSSFETINLLLDYEYFIGTNSKISIWVIILRMRNNTRSVNFYPKEIEQQLQINVPYFYRAKYLSVYQ